MLNKSESEIVQASFDRKLNQMQMSEVSALSTDLYNWCKYRLGHVAKDEDPRMKQTMIEQVANDLSIDYAFVTEAEVWQAVKRGMAGEYGDGLQIFSPNNVFTWIKRYLAKTKTDAMKQYIDIRNRIESQPKPSEQEQARIVIRGILEAYDAYRLDDSFEYRTYLPHYDFLTSIGIPVCTPERKKQVWKQELDRVKKMDWIGYENKQNEFTRFINSLENNEKPGSPNFFIQQAKCQSIRILMLEFFKSCAEMDMDLEKWIDDVTKGEDT